MRFIAADLGGTFLRCALAAPDGMLGLVERHALDVDSRFSGPGRWSAIVAVIADFSRRHQSDAPDASIVLSFPGPLRDGRPWIAPTVTGNDGVPDLRAMIARATGRECSLLNDVSAAAWHFATRVPARRFGVVTISSGIGFKIFDRPLGACINDEAGEIGHLVVDHSATARLCDCGGRGHLGALASGRAVEQTARIRARREPDLFEKSICSRSATAATLTNEADIVPAFRAGDRWASEIVDEAVRPLARVLAAIMVANGLECVAVMGGFAQAAGVRYRESLERAIAYQSRPGPAMLDPRAFVIASADEQPSLSGAAIFGAQRRAA